jgi:hypothetical protein
MTTKDGHARPDPRNSNLDADEAASIRSTSRVSLECKYVLAQWVYGEGAGCSEFPAYGTLNYEPARFQLVALEMVKKANWREPPKLPSHPVRTRNSRPLRRLL